MIQFETLLARRETDYTSMSRVANLHYPTTVPASRCTAAYGDIRPRGAAFAGDRGEEAITAGRRCSAPSKWAKTPSLVSSLILLVFMRDALSPV